MADTATEAQKGDGQATTNKYIDAIDRYDRGTQTWRTQCETINKIYLDQHRGQASPRRFAMLWSNIETLKPAVYARLPQAVVSRRFKDQDPVGRKAGETLERCINTTLDLYGVDETLQSVRDDRLLAARGQAWVRYEAEFEQSGAYEGSDAAVEGGQATDVAGKPTSGTAAAKPTEKLAGEHVCIDYVHWSDFGHTLNRTWPEVTAVWRRVYMTKTKVTKRWGKDEAAKLNYEVRPEYSQKYGPEIKDASEPQAVIYEIWDKDTRQARWLAKEEKITLEAGAPPLNFRNFFPCPKPAYGTRSTGSLIPTPDYRYYQDQAEEIDELTQKIDALTAWLKLKAFIPAGPSSEGGDAIKSMLQSLTEKIDDLGIFVPVESWSGWTEKGGSRMIDWLPIDMVAQALDTCVKIRQQLVQDVYQITGISDILRGETDPNETLGAQEIKAQTGSRRIQTCQRDLARFARDLCEMVGEVICEVFQPETIGEMSGFDMTVEPPPEMMLQAKALMAQIQPPMAPPGVMGQPPAPPPQPNPQVMQQLQAIQAQFQQIQQNKAVLELLRNEKTRNYRIEVETDSTIEPDESAEKQRRIEFVQAMGGFLQQALPLLQVMPKAAPLVGQTLLFMSRGFRAGRELEDTIEQTMDQVIQQAQQPPQPSPEQQAAEQEMKNKEQQHQQTMQQNDQKFQQETAQAQQQHELKMQDMRASMAGKLLTTTVAAATKAVPNAKDGEGHAPAKPALDPDTLMQILSGLAPKPRSIRVIRDHNGQIAGGEELH